MTSGVRVVSFRDVTPPARYRPLTTPWTAVRVEEAAVPTGPFTAIDTIALDPVDRLPARPIVRSLSTPAATLTEGWYRLVWLDDAGEEALTDAVFNAPGATTPTWAPSVQDVADLSPAYTRAPIDGGTQQSGAPGKVFDASTDPTDTDVAGLIAVAMQEVTGRVGVSVEQLEPYAELARRTAAWHAAASVEAEKSPEGAAETDGAYRWKQASYVACLNELIGQARGSSSIRLPRVSSPANPWHERGWRDPYWGW